MTNNDYHLSDECVGWTLFINKQDWEWLEQNLDQDSLKRLRNCRIGMISKEGKSES